MKGIQAQFRSLRDETDFWITDDMVVDGAIPQDISGTIFRNGPGLFEYGEAKVNHMFDGDGMICRLSFKDGKLHFTNKYVRTPAFLEEQAAQTFKIRSVFSSGNPTGGFFFNPFDFTFKNPANTCVVQWAGQLLALNEGGIPMIMDATTMETVKTDARSFDPTTPDAVDIDDTYFHAHTKTTVDPVTGERTLIGLGSSQAMLDMDLTMYEFSEDGKRQHKTEYMIPNGAFGFFHDFAVTDNYYCLVQNPTELDFQAFLTEYVWGKKAVAECIAFNKDKPAVLHVIPRPGNARAHEKPRAIPIEHFFVFHFMNAFETPVEGNPNAPPQISIDLLPMPRVDFSVNGENLSPEYYTDGDNGARLCRITADLAGRTASMRRLMNTSCEMPSVNPNFVGRKHTTGFVEGSRVEGPRDAFGPTQTIMQILTGDEGDSTSMTTSPVVQEWDAGYERIVTEPLFVPRKGSKVENDGYLVAMTHDWTKNTTNITMVDAAKIEEGPVCDIQLPFNVPFGLHGSYDPGLFLTEKSGKGPMVVNTVR